MFLYKWNGLISIYGDKSYQCFDFFGVESILL